MVNNYFVVLLTFLIVKTVMGLVLEMLNRSSMKKPIPIEFKGAFSEKIYHKAVSYARDCSNVNFVQVAVDMLFLFVFWFCGGFSWLDTYVRSFELPPIVTGICFILILEFIDHIIDTGFDIYQTFVLDVKYEFTNISKKMYCMDWLKNTVLTLGSTAIYVASFIFCLSSFGGWGVLLLIVSIFGFNLLMQKYIGIWMMYMFNTFTPLKAGRLKRAITKYTNKVNFPMKDVFIMNASARSNETNAFFAGIGSSRRIVLYDTLVKDHNIPELVAVIGHEVGHCVHNHITKGMVLDFIKNSISVCLLYYFAQQPGLFQAFGIAPSIYAAMVLISFVKIPWTTFINIFENILSRKWEREADQYELDTVNNPGASVRAFRKLATSNLANLNPHPLYAFLNYSHPPLVERVRHAMEFKKKFEEESK